MAQSVTKTAISGHKSILTHGHSWTPALFTKSVLGLAGIRHMVGIGFGINSVVTAYDSQKFDQNSGGPQCGSDCARRWRYKAAIHHARTVSVDPRYTSQTCPKCGLFAGENRDKRHRFQFQNCHYQSHDDRIGAMSLHHLGIGYWVTGATEAGPRP